MITEELGRMIYRQNDYRRIILPVKSVLFPQGLDLQDTQREGGKQKEKE